MDTGSKNALLLNTNYPEHDSKAYSSLPLDLFYLTSALLDIFVNYVSPETIKLIPPSTKLRIIRNASCVDQLPALIKNMNVPSVHFPTSDQVKNVITDINSNKEYTLFLQEFGTTEHSTVKVQNPNDSSLIYFDQNQSTNEIAEINKTKQKINKIRYERKEVKLHLLVPLLKSEQRSMLIKEFQKKDVQVELLQNKLFLLTFNFRITRMTSKRGIMFVCLRNAGVLSNRVRWYVPAEMDALPNFDDMDQVEHNNIVTTQNCFRYLSKHVKLDSLFVKKTFYSLWQCSESKKRICKAIKQSNHSTRTKRSHLKSFFSNEKALKGNLNDGNIMIYYSNQELEFIRNNDFEVMFVDGTFFVGGGFSQLVLIRFWSEIKKKSLTGCRAIMAKKSADDYATLFKFLHQKEFFKNIKIVMTDFEVGITNGIMTAIPNNNFSFRFCHFHFSKALRRYSGQINKTFEVHSYSDRVSPFIHVAFSLLMFVGASCIKIVFCFLKDIFRQEKYNIANEVFFIYFENNYVIKKFASRLFVDLSECPYSTNNCVEGTNKHLKKFCNNSKKNINNWILYNMKQTILNFDNTNVFNASTKCCDFQEKFRKGGNWIPAITDYIESLKSVKESRIKQQQQTVKFWEQFKIKKYSCDLITYRKNGKKEHTVQFDANTNSKKLLYIGEAEFLTGKEEKIKLARRFVVNK